MSELLQLAFTQKVKNLKAYGLLSYCFVRTVLVAMADLAVEVVDTVEVVRLQHKAVSYKSNTRIFLAIQTF